MQTVYRPPRRSQMKKKGAPPEGGAKSKRHAGGTSLLSPVYPLPVHSSCPQIIWTRQQHRRAFLLLKYPTYVFGITVEIGIRGGGATEVAAAWAAAWRREILRRWSITDTSMKQIMRNITPNAAIQPI